MSAKYKIVKERGDKCEVCGLIAKGLHLHHKVKARYARNPNQDTNNLVLCCQVCHAELEKWSNEGREPDIEAIRELRELLL